MATAPPPGPVGLAVAQLLGVGALLAPSASRSGMGLYWLHLGIFLLSVLVAILQWFAVNAGLVLPFASF